jgi:lipoprotein-anchoring transpeptidase ErfK/SrfK
MATAKQIRWAAAAIAVVLGAQAAQAADKQTAAKPASAASALHSGATEVPAPAEVKRQIVISLEDRKLALVENGQVVKVYPVAVGKPSSPSPVGTFTIARRVANPTYHHDGKTIPPGPTNPVGTRWMGLSIKGYGIHGTNEPKSIGKAASHGCIRMAKADLEDLYPQVQAGDMVEFVGHRDEETALLFGNGTGNGMPSAPTSQPVLANNAAPSVTAPATQPAGARIEQNQTQQSQTSTNQAELATAAVLTGAL